MKPGGETPAEVAAGEDPVLRRTQGILAGWAISDYSLDLRASGSTSISKQAEQEVAIGARSAIRAVATAIGLAAYRG